MHLDERPHERSVLVEGGSGALRMFREREPELVALLEAAAEVDERAEAKGPERQVKLRSTNSHAFGYAPGGPPPAWQPGHQ